MFAFTWYADEDHTPSSKYSVHASGVTFTTHHVIFWQDGLIELAVQASRVHELRQERFETPKIGGE